jgi:putative transposase
MGSGENRERVVAQARDSRVSANSGEVHAEATTGAAARRPAPVDVPEESREGHMACDFFVVVTATFRTLYVFVVIEHGTRRFAHVNVSSSPTADWTLQQLREVVGDTDSHRHLIHDRDRIFAKRLDASIKALGIEVLRSPVASPKANSICERVIGTMRRECLDWMIPISEEHLRAILKEWVTHYNKGRAHSALGPGVPDPPPESALVPRSGSRDRLAAGALVLAKSILGGLHHEYSLVMAPVSAYP